MKTSKITAERARELFEYDHVSGTLTWRTGRLTGREAGHLHEGRGYRTLWADGEVHLAHRLIWLIVNGEWPLLLIDHINGIKTDNRMCNLRQAGHRINAENIRRARSDNKVGLLGVHLCKFTNRYRVQIRVDGKHISIGRYDSAEQAHFAYLKATRQYHEGCTL